MHEEWQCRIAPSLGGGFAGTPNEVWGTVDYEDQYTPTVFFGCYGLPDFFTIWRHKGRRAILWAGSDVRHLINGYWLDTEGKIRAQPRAFAQWLNENCENWCENQVEYLALKSVGIEAEICPSFLGDTNDYPLLYKPSDKPRLYTSVSGDDFALYGWDKIPVLAEQNPGVEFHLYGNTRPVDHTLENIIVHGRVSQEQMNEEIQGMQGALRLTSFDGFSEILAKSVLWGQWPVSLIPYAYMLKPSEIHKILDHDTPNTSGRNFYLNQLNRFPWNANINP